MGSGLLSSRGEVLDALVDDVIAPPLLQKIRLVYRVSHRGEPEALGSCVLLRRLRQLFLVTAAHVIEPNKSTSSEEGSSLYVAGADGEFCLLEAEFLSNVPILDLAVAALRGSLAENWDTAPALDLDSDVAVAETNGLHLVLGYPIRRRSFSIDRTRNRVRHEPFINAQRRSEAKGSGHHFHIRMDRRHVRRGNKFHDAPSPRGVSGGGVFCLSARYPVLAGILIEYRRGTQMVVSKANRLFEFIAES
jgi:hypothetical protein